MKFSFTYINPKKFSFGYINPKVFSFIRCYPVYWWHYWLSLMDYLWIGMNFDDWLISVFKDRRKITIIGRDFITDYIPMASSSLFKLQNDADLILDDFTDHLWFDVAGNQNLVTPALLYNYDYTRIVIKCLHVSPYDISAIGVLKSGKILTSSQIDKLHYDFELWIFWNGTLNDYGYLKENHILP